MHYQSRLLPIDVDGGFLLAIYHGEHQIGGENTRETGYARFAVGRATEPADLRDLTAAFLPPRPPSKAAAKYERNMARAQGGLARSGSYSQSMSEYYSANERAALHSAELAERPALRVPRFVQTSTTGKALLVFPGYSRHQRGEELAGLLQLRDTRAGELVHEWNSGRPMAFSVDASTSLHGDVIGHKDVFLVECANDARWQEKARRQALISHASPVINGWVGVEGESLLHWFATGLHEQAQAKIPRGALGWTFRTTPDGALVAMSGTLGGDVFVLPRDGGKARRFSPHRGAPREARMDIALSDCGGWLASRCEDDLAITRLHDGVSWPLCELKDRVHQDVSIGDYVVHSSVPAAFAFIGGRLLLVEDGVVRTVDFAIEGAKAFVSEHGRAGARKPIRVKRSMSLPELLSAARLQDKADALAPLHSPAVAIKTKALGKSGWLLPTQRKGPATGSSRFGGWPDLPAGAEWPRWQQRPMAFLAQINLAEAHAVEPSLRLPVAGLLSFFLGCSEES